MKTGISILLVIAAIIGMFFASKFLDGAKNELEVRARESASAFAD